MDVELMRARQALAVAILRKQGELVEKQAGLDRARSELAKLKLHRDRILARHEKQS